MKNNISFSRGLAGLRGRAVSACAVACLTVFAVASSASGATIGWDTGVTGNWDLDLNWGGNIQPGAADRANVYSGVAQISSNVGSVSQFVMRGPAKVEINSGSLTATTSINQGSGGTGTSEIEINGGTLFTAVDDRWRIGNGSVAIFTLNSGSVLHAGAVKDPNVGVGTGHGTLNINGGLWDMDGSNERNLVISDSDAATGILNLRGGDFRERDVRIDKGNATVNVIGSAHTQIKVRKFAFESTLVNQQSAVNFFLDAGGITSIDSTYEIHLSDTTVSVGFDSGYDGTGLIVGDTFDLIDTNTVGDFQDGIGSNPGDFQMANIMLPGYDFTSSIVEELGHEILRIEITAVAAVPEPASLGLALMGLIGMVCCGRRR